jgi:hydroxymethylbilane synthase
MDALVALRPGTEIELVEITTTGDRITDRPLREAGGKGLFLKELDEALQDGRIDCAVHSMKDVPTDLADGTTIATVLARADPRDVLVTAAGHDLSSLPATTVAGTTSLRRQAQVLAVCPSASIRLLRGNVETRIRKLESGDCDATFLAAAGLGRLGIDATRPGFRVRGVVLDPFEFVPAPGQGTIAVTARADDDATIHLLLALEHHDSRVAATAERAFARVFGGGCHLPLAAFSHVSEGRVRLVGLLISPDGTSVVRDESDAALDRDPSDFVVADALGTALGQSFFDRGAAAILAAADAAAGVAS